jgi:GNAT superfamily N-acetyltransferase
VKFLVDTNILIPLEPTSPSNVEPTTGPATRFVRLAAENGHQIYIHASSFIDVAKDENRERQELRRQLLEKYPQVPRAPVIPPHFESVLGKAAVGSNDYVDNLMLAAVHADAIDWFVTQDVRAHGRARRLGLAERVLTILDAIQVIEDLAAACTTPPPVVESTVAHALDASDTILDSFRHDYPGFDKWLAKCKRDHRQTWVVNGDWNGIAAFCIVKEEHVSAWRLRGRTLKLCSFKVAERYQGLKYGELLLKTVFEYAVLNGFDWLFVTVFDHHVSLLDLLHDFGFAELTLRTELGESILAKPVRRPVIFEDQLDNLQRHIRYGPRCVTWSEKGSFLVPIQPRFARLLFPESAVQGDLFHGEHPFGSAIRKAYLCHASIRAIKPGAALAFYRSGEDQGIIAVGVVERAAISDSCEDIVRLVARRTVYSLEDIKGLCVKRVLVLLFRQALVLNPPISKEQAENAGLFDAPPQSIMSIKREGVEWLRMNLNL